MSVEISSLSERVLSAILNGTAQGLLWLIALQAVLRFAPGLNAATRHAINLLALLVLAALPVIHFAADARDKFAPTRYRITEPGRPSLAIADERAESFSERESSQVIRAARNSSASLNFAAPTYAAPILVALWLLLSAIRLALLARQCFQLRQLKQLARPAPADLRELFSRLSVELGVTRAPQLRTTPQIAAPLAAGFRSPCIFLPDGVCQGTTELRLEQILRHELAHVNRRDDWANLAQHVVRALLFFHPGVLWLSRRLTVDREIACDDQVLSAIGGRKAYALCLTEFASRTRGRDLVAAPAAWSSQSQLKQRVTMILDTKRNASPRLSRTKTGFVAAAAVAFAAAGFQAVPRLAVAASEINEAEPQVEVNTPAEIQAESGPRLKAVITHSTSPAAITLALPEPPEAPVIASVPLPPPGHPAHPPRPARHTVHQLASAGAAGASQHPDARPKPAPGDESIARRLDRLERMVESLMNKDGKPERGPRKEDKAFNFHFEKQWDGPRLSDAELARLKDEVQREVERAAREARKAAGDLHARIGTTESLAGREAAHREQIKAQRRSLEAQRKALEAQMRQLERRMDQLERQQEEIEENEERAQHEAHRANEEKRVERKIQIERKDGEPREKSAVSY